MSVDLEWLHQQVMLLLQGHTHAYGTFSLTSDGVATSTTVTNANVAATSMIFHMATDDGAGSLDGVIEKIVSAHGSFVVYHAASTLTRTYSYHWVTPISR